MKSYFQFERNPLCDGGRPEIAGPALVFCRQTFLLIPTALATKTLFEPLLIHIGELSIIIRRPDWVRQGIG